MSDRRVPRRRCVGSTDTQVTPAAPAGDGQLEAVGTRHAGDHVRIEGGERPAELESRQDFRQVRLAQRAVIERVLIDIAEGAELGLCHGPDGIKVGHLIFLPTAAAHAK
jgi:hypothetical protein